MSSFSDLGPDSTLRAVDAVQAAVGKEDYAGAAALADEALANGLIHPAFLNARAIWLERQGKDEEALALYQQARTFTPKNAQLLNAIGLCFTRLSRFDEALETFDEALRIAPAHASSHHRKGLALGSAGRWKEAEAAHARAAQLDPKYAEAIASVASFAARRGDERLAGREAGRALGLDPTNTTAHVALAILEIARGEFGKAETRLRTLRGRPDVMGHGRAVVLGLLGDALDGEDKPQEAFAAYAAANAEFERLHAPRFRGRTPASAIVEGIAEYFRRADTRAAVEPATQDPDGPRVHAFLLGFPRSGTTLLEQALESQGDVVTLEERDMLADFGDRYLTNESGLDRLANLQGPALSAACDTYWQRARAHGLKIAGKVFVDKHPLNTIKLPLIARLFPDAKILFAIRDPRDVVFSCFRRHLDIDLAKFELLTLEGAARLYGAVMELGMLCRQRLPLSVLEVRYEDLVSHFDERTRAVCDFLGITWNERMRDFAATARTLDARHASAEQVRRGLYVEGVGQWRRYEKELAPVLPALQPWTERFGYI